MFSLPSRYISHINTIADLNNLCGDGFAKSDFRCKCKRYQMSKIKNVFSAQNRIVITLFKRVFDLCYTMFDCLSWLPFPSTCWGVNPEDK